MSRIFAIANQKGGVGKTTTAINLSAALASLGDRVLLIDMDAQGNATTGSGINKALVPLSIYDALIGEAQLSRVTVHTAPAGYDLAPANGDLAGLSVVEARPEAAPPYHLLRDTLVGSEDRYDWIFVDAPPALGLATLNCLFAAHAVLVPVQCEYYALEGLSDLMQTMRKIGESLGHQLPLAGVLRTMYDSRSSLCNDVSEQLCEHFADAIYQTVIPRNIRLAEAPSYGLPVLNYSPSCKGSQAYIALAEEFRERAGGSR
ncbi:MAG: ParA family protein [Gammaproteobacteria bacterium AqS3]|nr:ParA family protein [Gammaproteobacteria bacterium AqS3]